MNDDLPPDSLDIGVPENNSSPDPFAGIEQPTSDISPDDLEYIHRRAARPYYNQRTADEIWRILEFWNKQSRKEMVWDTRKVNMSAMSLKQKLTNGLLFLRDKGTVDQRQLADCARIQSRRHLIVLNEISPDGHDLLLAARFSSGVDGEFLFEAFTKWIQDPSREHHDIFKYPNEDHTEVSIDDAWQSKFRAEFIKHREYLYGSVKHDSIKCVFVKQTTEAGDNA